MDRAQFISSVEAVQQPLRRFLTALCCGDRQLADDIAQESLIKAYLSSDGLNDPDRFKAWLYRIAYNTFVNSKRGSVLTVGYSAAANIVSVETSDSAFRYEALYKALGQLPDKERTSVLLFYLEGYSVKEIAAISAASEHAVKQQLSRGRQRLRELLNA